MNNSKIILESERGCGKVSSFVGPVERVKMNCLIFGYSGSGANHPDFNPFHQSRDSFPHSGLIRGFEVQDEPVLCNSGQYSFSGVKTVGGNQITQPWAERPWRCQSVRKCAEHEAGNEALNGIKRESSVFPQWREGSSATARKQAPAVKLQSSAVKASPPRGWCVSGSERKPFPYGRVAACSRGHQQCSKTESQTP